MVKNLSEKELRSELDKANDFVRPIAHALADLVLEEVPSLVSTLAWNFVCFSGENRVVSIIPHSKHVNLQFWQGAHLPDEHGLLDGTGKDLRHVKCRSVEETRSEKLKSLLRDATLLDQKNQKVGTD